MDTFRTFFPQSNRGTTQLNLSTLFTNQSDRSYFILFCVCVIANNVVDMTYY